MRRKKHVRIRLLLALLAIVGILLIGSIGYYLLGYYALGAGIWPYIDCIYMSAISISTVGFGEVLPHMATVPGARLYTVVLIFLGTASVFYAVSVLTTLFIEGEFFQLRRQNKMEKRMKKLSGHTILCGVGRTGKSIYQELRLSKEDVVAIDQDLEAIQHVTIDGSVPETYIVGDPRDDQCLIDAGITRANGLVTALGKDADNLFVVVSARALNPSLRIVSKAVDPRSVSKLKGAGADSVVSVNQIGGIRIASRLLRPAVVDFFETIMGNREEDICFEQIQIPPGSEMSGKALSDSGIRGENSKSKLLVVAARRAGADHYTYSPGPDFELSAGMTLIVLGDTIAVKGLRRTANFATG